MEKKKLTIPIQVNLPDNWLDLVIEKIKQDDDWVLPIRCRECKYYQKTTPYGTCLMHDCAAVEVDDYCSMAEWREDS